MSFEELLSWLTGPDGGAFALISWAVAWGLEGTDAWEKLSSKVKTLIILAVSLVLGIGAAALQMYPDVVEFIEPFFRPVLFAIMAWLGTQTAHRLDAFRR